MVAKVIYEALLEFSAVWKVARKSSRHVFSLSEECGIYHVHLSHCSLPVAGSQTEPVYSTHSDELWSSRSRASGCCFYANTSVSGSSGTPPMLTSRWTSLQQSLLGREMHPMTSLGRAGLLKRKDKRIIWSGFSNCWVSLSFSFNLFLSRKSSQSAACAFFCIHPVCIWKSGLSQPRGPKLD